MSFFRPRGSVASVATLNATNPHLRAWSSAWRTTVWHRRTVRGDSGRPLYSPAARRA